MNSILFNCHFMVPFHGSKNKKGLNTAKKIIANNDRKKILKDFLTNKFIVEKLKQRIDTPIDCKIEVCFKFYFPETLFNKSKQLPELAGLYELPQAVLVATGVIASISLIESHDGSRRVPTASNSHYISIEIRTLAAG